METLLTLSKFSFRHIEHSWPILVGLCVFIIIMVEIDQSRKKKKRRQK